MRGARRGWAGAAVLAALLGGVGCFHTRPHIDGVADAQPLITVPPPGAVPRELDKVTLPPYVIEAPDNLLIEVVRKGRVPVTNAKGEQVLNPATGEPVTEEGMIGLPVQAISGPFQVRIDGSVGLGFWGSVTVSGLSLDQAGEAIRQQLLRHPTLVNLGYDKHPENLFVIVDVLAYNSKRYYVITDGGGYGEQVYPFPITGSETVLDAIGNITGLPAVASKRNIWVARRCPHPDHPWQILPVDWIGITQHGITTTNYQLMPGDRVYVKAQKLVTIDTALARIISPIERVFGITLLGASTVNQIQGRGQGFGNTGVGP